MTNNITALIKLNYSKTLQALLYEKLIAYDIANTILKERLPNGNRVHFPRVEYGLVDNYTKYNDVVDQFVESEDEFLEINQTPIIPLYFEDIEVDLETGWEIVSPALTDSFYQIKQDIEGNFFSEVVNAEQGNGTPVALAANNVVSTFGNARAELENIWVEDLVAVVDPFIMQTIWEGALGNTFQVADESYKRGYKGMFQNLSLYQATNLLTTWALALANDVTAADTVTINWVTFTFVASIGTAAGNVLAGANAAASRANLIAAINGAAGAGTTYVEVSKANRRKLQGITATEVGTTVVLTSKRGYKKCSSNLTHADNKFGAFTINVPVMARRAIHLVMQKELGLKVQDVQKRLATRYMIWGRYGIKTFKEGRERMYRLQIIAQAAE